MTTNINVNPYNDDFDEFKNYYQLLFKPGFAVQARELTQLQSILKDQVAKFGNHIFQHGSVVIPGNSFADLSVPFIKLQTQFNDVDIDTDLFLNKKIIGETSGIQAIVKKVVEENDVDPITFYLSYVSGSAEGNIVFQPGEEVYLEDDSGVRAVLQENNATGVGSLAFVNTGVYYIKGTFVSVEGQSIVMSKYDSVPNCHVLFRIVEEIVDYKQDSTLLDPAFGSYNYLAPGSDRLKITLELTILSLESIINDNYVEIMRYRNGVLEEHAKNAKYSELEKSLARRTFDESGNYIVRGLKPTLREHLRVGNNNGVYANGNSSLLIVEVDPGKAYINGFEVEKLSTNRIEINKARTEEHIQDTSVILRPEYGQYIIVSNIVGSFSAYSRQVIDIYNDNDVSSNTATKIGTARVLGIDYLTDTPGANAIYKLWISDLNLIQPFTIESAGGISFSSGSAYVLTEYTIPVNSGSFTIGEFVSHSSGRTATVRFWQPSLSKLYAFKHDHTNETPKSGDLITGSISGTISSIQFKEVIVSVGQIGMVFTLPKVSPNTLIDVTTSSFKLNYTVQKQLSIVTDVSGNGSISVSSGERIDPIEVGTFVALGPAGVIENALFSLNTPGTTLTLINGPSSAEVRVYAAVSKTDLSPKSKTVTTHSQVVTSPQNVVTLSKTDVISITSVIDSIGDITPNYIFWNGQNDYSYNRATLTLKPGARSPVGNITVTYSYYQHSISGDFFCIDSYPSGILETNTSFKSPSSGEVFYLPACLDFRPSVGENGEFTGANSRRNDLLLSGTTFNTSLRYYVPRIDVLTVGSTGKLSVVSGIPSENPVVPTVPSSEFSLNYMYIPEYTRSFSDVVVRRLPVERYTMQKISEVSERIDRIEDFVILTVDEQSVVNYEIIDAVTGLNRFKTGFLVEKFSTPFTIARTTSSDFAVTFIAETVHPSMEDLLCNLEFLNSSSNYVIKKDQLMLPYTEEVFASQTLSSRVTNINPFLVIRWDGLMSVNPPSDDWVDTRDLPDVFETVTDTVILNNYIPCPPPPPPPPQPVETWNPDPEPVLTPLPNPTYGGIYGSVLGRAADTEGVNWWVTQYNAGNINGSNFGESFVGAAMTNQESTINAASFPNSVNASTVISSVTTYSYGSSGQIVATTTSTTLNGATFTSYS